MFHVRKRYANVDSWLSKSKICLQQNYKKEKTFLCCVSIFYIAVSLCWIHFSDYFLLPITDDNIEKCQRIKEYLLILLTLITFYLFINKHSKAINEELKSKIDEVMEVGRTRNDFLNNVSHEFRTLINIILGTVQLVDTRVKNKSSLTEEDINKYLTTIRQNCYRLLKLVNNQLDISRMDAGYINLNLQLHNIIDIIKEIVNSVNQYVEDNLINLEFYSEVKEKIMFCDVEKVERILLNLLTNAVKYTDPGGHIWVKVFDKGENILILVKDTGIGIPKNEYDSIFEKFARISSSKTVRYEGSGIGLFLVKKFVELHYGKVWVESEVGKGSEFYVELPVLKDRNRFKEIVNFNIEKEDIRRINIEFSDLH